MVQCKKCKLFLSVNRDDIVKCKGMCEGVFHKKCVQSQKQFFPTENCEDCQKTKVSQTQETKLTINPNETSGEKVLAEINKKLEVLYSMEKKIEDLTTNVEFYAEMYQTLISFKEESQKKIKYLEHKNVYLEKYSKALEERVQELEVREKEKNIQIHGLEMQREENTKVVIQNLAQKLTLNPDDIENAQRVGQEKTGDSKPKTILVTLRSVKARNEWIKAKKEKKVTNNIVYNNGSENRIFINEDLPKHKRQLLWLVRNKLKPKGFQYIWIQNGNILVKKNSNENKIYNIRTEEELSKLE